MRLLATAILSSLIAAGPAFAGSSISDRDYLQLARCVGLATGAGEDASALEASLREANRGRAMRTRDRSHTIRRNASLEMRGATGEERTRLDAERSARCVA